MLNAPAIAPVGEARSNNDVFRALAARLGFEPDLFPDDETLIREALDGGPTIRGITLERLRDERSVRLDIPEPTPRSPTASSRPPRASASCIPSGWPPTASTRCPTYVPPREDPQTRPDLAALVPDPAPEPAPAAVPQLDLRQLPEPPRGRRRPDRRAVRPRTPRPEGWSTASGPRSTTTGGRSGPGSPSPAPSGPAWRSPPGSTGTSSSPAAATPTARPPPP